MNRRTVRYKQRETRSGKTKLDKSDVRVAAANVSELLVRRSTSHIAFCSSRQAFSQILCLLNALRHKYLPTKQLDCSHRPTRGNTECIIIIKIYIYAYRVAKENLPQRQIVLSGVNMKSHNHTDGMPHEVHVVYGRIYANNQMHGIMNG